MTSPGSQREWLPYAVLAPAIERRHASCCAGCRYAHRTNMSERLPVVKSLLTLCPRDRPASRSDSSSAFDLDPIHHNVPTACQEPPANGSRSILTGTAAYVSPDIKWVWPQKGYLASSCRPAFAVPGVFDVAAHLCWKMFRKGSIGGVDLPFRTSVKVMMTS